MTEQKGRVDLYRDRSVFFRAPRKPELVDLPEAGFLIVDGEGSPDSPAFQGEAPRRYGPRINWSRAMAAKSSVRYVIE